MLLRFGQLNICVYGRCRNFISSDINCRRNGRVGIQIGNDISKVTERTRYSYFSAVRFAVVSKAFIAACILNLRRVFPNKPLNVAISCKYYSEITLLRVCVYDIVSATRHISPCHSVSDKSSAAFDINFNPCRNIRSKELRFRIRRINFVPIINIFNGRAAVIGSKNNRTCIALLCVPFNRQLFSSNFK